MDRGQTTMIPCIKYKIKGVKNKIRELLSDGEFHPKAEIKEYSGCTSAGSMRVIIGCLRKELPLSEDIVCEVTNRTKFGYRLIRLINKRKGA